MKRNVKGLSKEAVIASREKYGDNALVKEKTKSFFGKFIENLSDPIIKVLLIAVGIEIIFTLGRCNWWETGGIILAVIIATGVSTASEYGSERAFERLQRECENATAKVMRDGEWQMIAVSEIVVGDLLLISASDTVYADGEVIEGKITVDQSALNGESREVAKYPIKQSVNDLADSGRVFRGSLVLGGSCIVQVDKVGSDTFYGMVARDVQTQTRESPLKIRLSKLASQISRIGYVMSLIVGITYLFFTFVVDNNFDMPSVLASLSDIPFLMTTLSHALTLVITVVVVAVPEGLPMMITVVLSANMRRMIKDKVMVKKLVGIETAGSMNILFTDKTGTLTTGKTVLDRVICDFGEFKSASSIRKHQRIFGYLAVSAKYGFEGSGNGTDKALLDFFAEIDLKPADIKSREPFSSDKKYSSVSLADGSVIMKGAPEIVLPRCRSAIGVSGELVPFNRNKIESKYRECAARSERVVACAVELGGELVFLSLFILKDKVRAGVKDAVAQIKRAGVSVVMITGDSKLTAAAVAKECGILKSDNDSGVYDRYELEKMTDEELSRIIPDLKVVARALPHDKTRLVRVSQSLGLVVGMTGDGINDAPSLKLADVGFGMGSGTDIAKSASDIVILDNSFEAISKTVLYGRTIFKSIRKFISFQLMMNLAACGVSLIGQFLGIDSPISIIQMLWVNIIMDTLGGLAFAGEPPLSYYMLEKTKSRDEKILNSDILHQIAFTGGYTLLLLIGFLGLGFFKSLFRPDPSDAYFMTGFYALFVFAGIFNCFNARCERMWLFSGIGKNKPFLLIMLIITVIQILMIYYGGEIFRTAPISPRELLNVFLLASSVIPFDIIRRAFKKLSA